MKFEFTTVKVIAWFDFDGTVHPMKFQLNAQDEQLITVKISRVIDRRIDKYAGNKMVQLTCECDDGTNVQKSAVLKYEVDTCKWFIISIN